MIRIRLIPAESIYMIRRTDQYNPWFFLYDCIEAPYDIVLWTPNRYKAREFYSEESVETYYYENLRQRPCEIIAVK